MMNKKAQSSTIGVTVAIILGILLIVFLVWGFSTNWSMFSSTSGAYTGETNQDALKQACQTKCDNGLTTDYCTSELTLKTADGVTTRGTCDALKGKLGISCSTVCT